MAAVDDLGALLDVLEQVAARPISSVDVAELAELAKVEEVAEVAEMWGDPLAHGQEGLDLVAAMMRRAANQEVVGY